MMEYGVSLIVESAQNVNLEYYILFFKSTSHQSRYSPRAPFVGVYRSNWSS